MKRLGVAPAVALLGRGRRPIMRRVPRLPVAALAVALVAVACDEPSAAPPPGPDRTPRTYAKADPPAAPTPAPADDGGMPAANRRPRDIPPGFANGLQFPEPRDAPVAKKPTVHIEPPTREGLAKLKNTEMRCPEGARDVLFIIDGDKTTSTSYEKLLEGAAALEIEGGDARPALPLAELADGADKLELWPCLGDPIVESLPSPMYVLHASQGFGKIIGSVASRRPAVRNVAAIVRLR